MSKVSDTNKAYTPAQAKRDVFAAVQSTDTIRAAGEKFLPKYPAEDTNEYNARKGAATIDGITASGVDVLTGAVFFDEIDTSKVEGSIVPLLENIDNKGNSFNVFARDAFKASFDGFSVIVIDLPKASGVVRSLEDERRLGMRPYWRLYKAKDVINWRYGIDPISKQIRLEMIVLKEVSVERDGRFGEKDVTKYRVYEVTNAGVIWELWLESGSNEPTQIDNGTISTKEIPVAFIGEVTDDPKLLVESRLEIKAYQKESSFDVIEYLQIPVLWTKGYPKDDPPLAMGASTHVRLPGDQFSDIGYVQTDANGNAELKLTIASIKDLIRSKVNEMIESTEVEETATAAVIKDRDKQARLIVWADELKDALERALQFTAQLMGLGEDKGGEIVLRTKWAVGEEVRQEQITRQRALEDADNTIIVDEGKN